MKAHAIAALFLTSLSATAFALPSEPQPVLGESRDNSGFIQVVEPVAENGSDRTPGLRVAEGGAERTLNRVAEDCSDRTPGFRVAEDGADRTPGFRVAEDGADRTPGFRAV